MTTLTTINHYPIQSFDLKFSSFREDCLIGRLQQFKDKSVIDIIIDIAKMAFKGGIKEIEEHEKSILLLGGAIGMGVGIVADAAACYWLPVKPLSFTSLTIPAAGVITAEIIGNASYFSCKAIKEGYDEAKRQYHFFLPQNIDDVYKRNFEPVQDSINAVINDERFVSTDAATEVIDPLLERTKNFCLSPVSLKCNHIFEKSTLEEKIKNVRRCPTCDTSIGEKDIQFSWKSYFRGIKLSGEMYNIIKNTKTDNLPIELKEKNIDYFKRKFNPVFKFGFKHFLKVDSHIQKALDEAMNFKHLPFYKQSFIGADYVQWAPKEYCKDEKEGPPKL